MYGGGSNRWSRPRSRRRRQYRRPSDRQDRNFWKTLVFASGTASPPWEPARCAVRPSLRPNDRIDVARRLNAIVIGYARCNRIAPQAGRWEDINLELNNQSPHKQWPAGLVDTHRGIWQARVAPFTGRPHHPGSGCWGSRKRQQQPPGNKLRADSVFWICGLRPRRALLRSGLLFASARGLCFALRALLKREGEDSGAA